MSMVSRRQFLYSLGVIGAGAGFGLPLLSKACTLPETTQTQLMMGTFVTISARNQSASLLEEALADAFQQVKDGEALFTRHSASSPLGVLNAQGSLRNAPAPLLGLLGKSLKLATQTQGGFNPAIVPVLDALNASGAASVSALPKSIQTELRTVTDPRAVAVQGNHIRLSHSGMGLSLDGIAKGHIVDLATARLERRGITDYLINAGGDIRVGSAGKSWAIGIQDGNNPARNSMVLPLRSGAIATSGNYESLATKGYAHLVPGQLNTRSSLISVTAAAPSCAEADSLATALFAMGTERGAAYLKQHPQYSCVWQTTNGVIPSSQWSHTV